MSHKHDMLIRLHFVQYEVYLNLNTYDSIKARELYETYQLTYKMIFKSFDRYYRRHNK